MLTRALIYIGVTLLLLFFAASVAPSQAQEQPQNQAGVIIRFGDGHVTTSCVTFSEPSLSGLELLQRSGAQVIAQQSGVGAAVCKIGGEGCDYPTEDCFCKCKSADCQYWAYQRLHGDRWAYSPLGALASNVLPGEVDGWAWGAGSVEQGAAPPVIPLEQICTVPATVASTTLLPEPTTTPIADTPVPALTSALPTQTVPQQLPTVTQTLALPTHIVPTVTTQLPSVTILQPTLISQLPSATLAVPVAPTAIQAPSAEPQATVQPEPANAAQATSPSDYLTFGIILLVLAGGILVAIRRNR